MHEAYAIQPLALPRALPDETRAVAIQREPRCAAKRTTNHRAGSKINRAGAAGSDVPPGSGVTGEFAALNIAQRARVQRVVLRAQQSQKPTAPTRRPQHE